MHREPRLRTVPVPMGMLAAVLAIVLGAPTAHAVPMARGTLTQYVDPVSGTYSGTITFDDSPSDVFGTSINLGTALVPPTAAFSGGVDFTTNRTSGHVDATAGPGVLSYDFDGSVIFGTPNYVVDVAPLSGTAVATLPLGLVYTADGAVTCGAPLPPGNCTGAFTLHAYQPQGTPASPPNCSGSACEVSISVDEEFVDPETGTPSSITLAVTFADVGAGGATVVKGLSNVAASIPSNVALDAGGFTSTYFDVSTTATVTPPITICVAYADADDDGTIDGTTVAATDLRLLHKASADGNFVDVTAFPIDTAGKRVCGQVTSLSPFVVAVNTTCGDGVVDAGEGCDDGASTPGDGCDAACQVQAGYACIGTPSVCTPLSSDVVPIVGSKLIVVDKTMLAGQAKAVFVAKGPNITKGTGIDPAQIEATLDVAYDAVRGTFDMPQGINWLVNSPSVAKYVNKTAPTDGAVKVSVIKPASLVKVVGRSLGDTPLDISSAPTGKVYVVETIVNGGDTTRLCTQFAGCVHKGIGGGTGYKLVCKGTGSGDPACTAVAPTTTSTTLATTTSSNTSTSSTSSSTSTSTSTTTSSSTSTSSTSSTSSSTSTSTSTSTTTSTSSTTLPDCNFIAGACWYLGVDGASCGATCAAQGRTYDEATRTFAGSEGTNSNCIGVMSVFGLSTFNGASGLFVNGDGMGCVGTGGSNFIRDTNPTSSTSSSPGYRRACACSASARFSDLGTGVIADSATGLEWEKKTTTVGSGVNGADLHDVDNTYRWAGNCSVTTSKYCQPNLAAETVCKAQTPGAYWTNGCEQCVGGEGTCTVATPAITTAWDWLSQVNAANFGGHNDWRLPSESACNTCFTNGSGGLYQCTSCSAHELETLLLSAYPCGTSPCIDGTFGPTSFFFQYWSASTYATSGTDAWYVNFFNGAAGRVDKAVNYAVRAVRGGS